MASISERYRSLSFRNQERIRKVAFGATATTIFSGIIFGVDALDPTLKLGVWDVTTHAISQQSKTEETIEQAVQKGLGTKAWINCTSLPEEKAGRTMRGTRIMLIQQTYCDTLARFAKDPVSKSSPPLHDFEVGWAARIVTHEQTHTQGEKDEDKTECYAIQKVGNLLLGLGASNKDAAFIAAQHANTYVAPDQEYTPPKECRRDGTLDLNLMVGGKDFFPGDPDPLRQVEKLAALPSEEEQRRIEEGTQWFDPSFDPLAKP